jgi:peptidoglycan/LPS O-acetylase OafA/YrhL
LSSLVAELKPLTSLRFVAAIMIVMLHANVYFGELWPWLKSSVPATAVHGVSFFFVLSGFILTYVYSSKPKMSYGAFILTRFARLWPVHVLAIIILVTFVQADSVTFDGFGVFRRQIVLLVNLAMMQSAVPTVSYMFSWNAVSWSISTEFFFYLAFPFLLTNIETTWWWKLAASAAVAALTYPVVASFGIPPHSPDVNAITILPVVYASPLGRGFEFCMGMSACVIWQKYAKGRELNIVVWSVLEAAAVFFVWLWLENFTILIDAAPASLKMWVSVSGAAIPFAALMVAIASGRGIIGKTISLRPFVWLGQISFSIYMLHQVLMKIFAHLPPQYVSEWTLFGTILALSVFSFYLVEAPGRSMVLRFFSWFERTFPRLTRSGKGSAVQDAMVH